MIRILILILVSLSLIIAQDCELDYSYIDGECYFEADIAVLEQFLHNSQGSINMILDDNGNGTIEPLELCDQVWVDGRISEFDCYPIIINGNYNWIDVSGEIPYNLTNWTEIERLIMPYNDLSGLIPDDICELNLDFSNEDVFDLRSNQLCPPYPECIEDYMDYQSNFGTGSCELGNCYDYGIGDLAILEFNGDNFLNPTEDSLGQAAILVNVYNDGPSCTDYPGLMITADAPGIEFPFLSLGEDGQFLTFWYAIFADATYYNEIPLELSPFVPDGTEINLTIETVTLNCYEESCSEDPYCHDCPLTPAVEATLIVGNSLPNRLGDANTDEVLDILDLVIMVDYILSVDQSEYNEALRLLDRLIDVNEDTIVNILDAVLIIEWILN